MQGVTSWKVVISLFQRNLTEANVYVKFEEDRDPIQFFQFLWLQLCFKALPYKVVRLSLTKHSRLGGESTSLLVVVSSILIITTLPSQALSSLKFQLGNV